MPRKNLLSREEILQAALALTEERGFDAVSARALGERLGTSTRPIFSRFDSMAQVQSAVIEAAYALYQSYLKEDMEKGEYPPFKASGMAYIRFAREKKELFRLLFLRDRTQEEKDALSEEAEAFAELICKQVRISKEQARLFHLELWTYVHGIATMIVTGFSDWSEALCSQTLTDLYLGLKYKYENANKEGD